MLKELGLRMRSVVVLFVLASLLGIASPHFFSFSNLINILQQSSINAILGIGLTFVIISAGIDLSVGSIMALASVVIADLLVSGQPTVVAILAGLCVATICGAINGLVTTLTRIPPFITTLGMMLIARSAAKIYSNSQPISGLPESFQLLAGNFYFIPIFVLLVLLFYVGAHVVLNYTKFGRYAYAMGDNEQAAWLSGVPVSYYKIALYTLSGMLAGVAAVLITARLNAASPLTGEMYELYAIAAAVIGGVSLMGGEGTIWGTLIGALIMGMLRNGLNLLNVPSAWEGVVVGVVLVLAVIFDRLRQQNTTQTQVQKKIKNKILVPSLLILAFFFAFNHRLEQPANSQQPTVIALITKANGSSYWQRMQAGAEEEAKKHHIKLLTMAPDKETDVERQYQLIENAIQQKVAAILLAPAGTKELITAIKKANQANIPVLLLDTKIDRKEAQRLAVQVESFIGSDNFKGGELAGKALAESIYFTGSVGIIEGISGHETAESRRLGFLHALHEYPEIKVVASQTAHWERERSYSVTQNMLQTHPDIRAIFCASDEMAMGSVEALRALQRKDVVIVGFDANPDALAYVINKKITATVAQSPRYMGMKGVYYAHQLLQHKIPPPAIHPTPLNLVTANNAQKFVF